MKDLVKKVRDTEKAMGFHKRVLSESELKSRQVSRRSFAARTDIKKGEMYRHRKDVCRERTPEKGRSAFEGIRSKDRI